MSYNVKFLAVVRVSDLVVAMTAARGDGAGAHHGMLEKVLTSGGLRSVKAGSRHTLEEKSEGVKFHFTIDASNTYVLVVITDFDYPVRLAFDLLNKQLLGKVSSQYAAKVASCRTSESRIRDTDMADEMVNFTKNQILQQAGTAMLGQANAIPQSVLRLLG